ncbi:MAG TPA: di-heme oxidoredictase family protein [Chitinophagaceae bacterium]|nr:MAG: thiol oxidoreductase [Bacteroidetes bacterium OLB11]HMN33201.1 di-heme oxidoredictase family protein [Chitinophagaceae bacterium]
MFPKNKILVFSTIVAFIIITSNACKKTKFEDLELNNEMLSGGMQTVFDEGNGAYGHSFANMSAQHERVHEIGDIAFEQTFVSNPAPLNGGLGPIYNNVSCISCHIGDGRGKAPEVGQPISSILFRISQSNRVDMHNGPLGVIGYGDQIQNRSVAGSVKEADIEISYIEKTFQFDDGTPYSLRFPTYTLTNMYMPITSSYDLSPRVASPVFGLGLLEAVSEQDILANADEFDMNNDGISGKANYVWNVLENKTTLGRFGWKANQPTVMQQSAGAINSDMGLTSFVFPQENSFGQIQYDHLDDDVEVSDSLMHAIAFYIKTLAVPARRNITDPKVARGKQLFIESNCSACHLPTLKTAVNVAFPALSNQTIRPYTDLLLHDMGAELADNRPDFLANGYEWRTPPLWGIGLTYKVNGHTNFLHDGRARNLMEAVMWHGGEAEASKNKVKSLNKADREALIKFLESL